MTDEFVAGCIQHQDVRHVRLYNDYMLLFNDLHKAMLIRILETWTDNKRANWYQKALECQETGKPLPEIDLWISMSYKQFSQYMYGIGCPETNKKKLAEIVKDGYAQRRVNPKDPYGSPQYLLNTDKLQQALNKQTPPSLLPPTPGGNSTPTQGVNVVPPPPNGTPTQGGKDTPPQGGKTCTPNNSTKNPSKNPSKNEEEVPSSRSAPPSSASSSSVLKFEKILPDNEDRAFKATWETDLFPLPSDQDTWRAIRTLREAETSVEVAIESYKIMKSEKYWKIDREGKVTITNVANNIGKYATQAMLNLQEQNQRSYDQEEEAQPSDTQDQDSFYVEEKEQASYSALETVHYHDPDTGETHTTQLERKYTPGRHRNDLAALFGTPSPAPAETPHRVREKVAVAS